ncbi:MAG: molybdate ABC transporter substrate-binding protein [bacterium]
MKKLTVFIFISILLMAMSFFMFNKFLNSIKQGKTELTIMVAAGLTDIFKEFKTEFEKKHPNIKLNLNIAGSPELASQIENGVDADIFVSGNIKWMEYLVKHNLVDKYYILAINKVIIGVNKEKSLVKSISDLSDKNVKLSMGDPNLPMGEYALKILDKLQKSGKMPESFTKDVQKNVVSKELNVKSIVAKIEFGEVDAGFIYKTDITDVNKDKIFAIQIPDEFNVIVKHPVAILKDSKNKELSKQFLDFILSKEGDAILKKYSYTKN